MTSLNPTPDPSAILYGFRITMTDTASFPIYRKFRNNIKIELLRLQPGF
jgi:hypothetical protein